MKAPSNRIKTATEQWLTWGGVALSLFAIALILVGLFTSRPAPTGATVVAGTPQSGAAPEVGKFAPDFTLRDTTGTLVHLLDLRGKAVVLDFWYVDCEGCRVEMPALQHIYQQDAPVGLVVLGIDIADSPQHAAQFAQSIGASYPLIFDHNLGVVNEYRITGTPTSVFIDRAGVIRAIFAGTLDDATLIVNLKTIGF